MRKLIVKLFVAVLWVAIFHVRADDGIKDGVHGYTPKGYVQPTEPEVLERLEWFKDQKLALFLSWGIHATIGIGASWPLSDRDAKWSRRDVDWTKDTEEFKRQYIGLRRGFNPIRFQPEKWAEVAKRDGFKYLIFTTKHHDGFCMYDTKYSDYKITAPDCPFSVDKRANVTKHIFDAFRKEGLGIAAYFSKSDWYNEDYWENHGLGRVTSRNPTYDIKKNPKKWARFREYTRNQIIELVRDYGKVDILWLDGGQVQRRYGQDIRIEEIIAEARKYNPGLISVDRTAGGPCENVITPEQTVPKTAIAVPWESCVTLGASWTFRFYEEKYKSDRELVHMLIDVVAKGGNLALGVGVQPDGRLPLDAVKRMDALGEWLKVNGEAIYETRPLAPFRKGDWAFTRNRRTGAEYAIRLWKEGEKASDKQSIPDVSAAKVVHVATGRTFDCTAANGGVTFELPADFKSDPNADVFRIDSNSRHSQQDILPSEAHLQYQDREIMALVCWGLNPYTGQEWGFGNVPVSKITAKKLDPAQWVRAMKAGEIKSAVLVAKHHDGFCLWPSKLNQDYSMAAVSAPNTGRDLVREMSDACRREGMKFGVYLSPWDRHQGTYATPGYVDYYHAQWKDLLENYGEICEVWLDGANGGTGWYGGANGGKGERRAITKDYYRYPDLLRLMHERHPNAVAFGGGGEWSAQWCGNERGISPETWWCVRKGRDGRLHWLPSETDFPLRSGWYWHAREKPKSLARLVKIYFESVGRGAVMNIGIAPDTEGQVCEADAKRLAEFGEWVRDFNSQDFAKGAKVTESRNGNKLVVEIALLAPTEFNCVDIKERIAEGQKVSSFLVEVPNGEGWTKVCEGTTVGHRRLARFSTAKHGMVRVTLDGIAPPSIFPIALRRAIDAGGGSEFPASDV